jgi:hypothetical protein
MTESGLLPPTHAERTMFDECAELDRVAETKTAVRSSAFMGYGNGGRRNRGNAVSKTHLPPLNDPHKFMATIGAGRSTSDYAKNSDIFVQGADADSIFYLQDGRVKVTVISEQGSQRWNLGSGSILWRRLSEWAALSNCHDNGADGLSHNHNPQSLHDPGA